MKKYRAQFKYSFIQWPLLFNLILSPPALGEDIQNTSPISAYTAKYIFLKNGMAVAEAVFTLSQTNNGWLYNSHAKPKGFASLFTNTEITESSAFEFKNNRIKPLYYEYRQGPPEKQAIESLKISYDWQNNIASITEKNETRQLPIQAGTYDSLSVQLALMREVQSNCGKIQYSVLDEMKAEQRVFECGGIEPVRTPIGEHQAVKVIYRNGKRETITWLAPDMNYIPVKIQQFKDKKLKSEMNIHSAKFSSS